MKKYTEKKKPKSLFDPKIKTVKIIKIKGVVDKSTMIQK